MSSVLRSVAVFSFIAVVALMSAPGCSQQGEGERCDDTKNGDLDCDDGLVCVASSELRDKTGDRCCAPSETDRTGLCTPSGVETETPDEPSGSGGAAGAGGTPASDAGGGGTSTSSAGQSSGGVPSSAGSGTNGGVPSVDGGAPAAGAATGGAGNPSNGGQGGAD